MAFSDTIVGVFVGASLTAWTTFLVFVPKSLEERIEENKKEWLLSHKTVSDKLEDPRDWRRQAVMFGMGSWLLFALQLITQDSNNLFASSELDDYTFALGFAFLLFGVFRSYHIGEFLGDRNNNRMECLNGEFRDREKVMRGVKKMDSPTIRGYQIFHNYIRPHSALNGETPADRAGIKVEEDDKWFTIIQNAKHAREAKKVG